MLSPRGLSASFAVLGLALAATSFSHAGDIFKAKLYPKKGHHCRFSADVRILRDQADQGCVFRWLGR